MFPVRRLLPSLAALALLASPLALRVPVHAAATAVNGTPTARVIVKFKTGAIASAAASVNARVAAAEVKPGIGARSAAMARTQAVAAHALAQRVGLPLSGGVGIDERTQRITAVGIDSAALAEKLSQDPDVEYAEVDQRRRRSTVPNDPLFPNGLGGRGPAVGQWYLRAPDSTFIAAIDAERAWDHTTGSNGVVIALLDTGVRYEHPDLKSVNDGGNLLPGYDMVSEVNAANDGDGRDADPSDPGDWVSESDISSESLRDCTSADIEESSWHGTQTAGIVGAVTDNSVGMASVGRGVRVLPVRVLGKCGGTDSDIAAGIRWAAGLTVPGASTNPSPAKVISLSLGGPGPCTRTYADAVRDAIAEGAVVVASAGNSAGHAVEAPGNCTGVVAVGGLRHAGSKVGYSNLGSEVAISAPAGNCVNTLPGTPCLYPILTTVNTGTNGPDTNGSDYTDSLRPTLGTSFAAPLVAAAAALMVSARVERSLPALTPAQLRAKLQDTARRFPTQGGEPDLASCTAPQYDSDSEPIDQEECYCTTSTCGAGMLDVHMAVLSAAGYQAQISASSSTAVPGQAFTLNGSGLAEAGATVASYQWALVDGGGIVDSLGTPTSSSVTVTPSAAGQFTVSLTVTYDSGTVSKVSKTVVAEAPAPPPPPPASGGGGSVDCRWLIGLLCATMWLAWERRRG